LEYVLFSINEHELTCSHINCLASDQEITKFQIAVRGHYIVVAALIQQCSTNRRQQQI